jgi:hypothetical protein
LKRAKKGRVVRISSLAARVVLGRSPVHLGPGGYVDGQKVKLEAGDKVSVQGSRITFDGKPAIVAAEIRKGSETLRLRAENGTPLWAGKHRR